MSTITRPSLAELAIDAFHYAYWLRRANIEECPACAKNPAGVAPCHVEDNDYAFYYEEARKRISEAASDGEVLALLAGERVT